MLTRVRAPGGRLAPRPQHRRDSGGGCAGGRHGSATRAHRPTSGAVILANQLSVGWSNEPSTRSVTRCRTRRQTDRARGRSRRASCFAYASVSALAANRALGLALGWAAALAQLVFLASGWAYNAGLKNALWRQPPANVVGFASLPLIVTHRPAKSPAFAAWWAVAIGGCSVSRRNVANVLPDLDADARHGIRSLPHVLGARGSGVTALLALAMAAALGALGPPVVTSLGMVGSWRRARCWWRASSS